MAGRDEYRTEDRNRRPVQRPYEERRDDRRRQGGDSRNRGREDSRISERSRENRAPENKKEYEAMQKKRIRNAKRKRAQRNRLYIFGAACILFIIIIIIVVSCSNKNKRQQAAAEEPLPQVITQEGSGEIATDEITATVVDIVNEKPVNLYTMDYNTMTCNKVTELNKQWSVSEDLEAFGAFATSENSFSFTTETQAHNDTWNSIQTETTYKIGYELSFDVGEERKVITILKPGDIENNADLYNGDYPESGDYSGITGYMGVWVYDDINQVDGEFYIHITQAEVTDNTLLTSIKLRPTPQSDQISNLVLKAFSYSSTEEFDADGHYIGKYAATVKINK